MTERPKRPSANKTRERILAAAKQIFIERGFEAAFIKDIAKLANVNTNLIFHHFTNKESLWYRVKADILGVGIPTPVFKGLNARDFFQNVFDYRFELFISYPDLARLIQWQQVSNVDATLTIDKPTTPRHILPIVRDMQARGQLRKAIDPRQIMTFMLFSSMAPFWQNVVKMTNKERNEYKDLLVEMCCSQFATKKGQQL